MAHGTSHPLQGQAHTAERRAPFQHFCLAFNSGNTKVFSGGNDEQVILHDVESSETLDVFAHEDAVYGLSVSPVNDNIFASSSDDGRVLIWDIRESPMENPSAWQTIHQPFIVSCLTLWSPGCWPQPIQRKEWDSGTFANLRVLSCAMVETCPSKVP